MTTIDDLLSLLLAWAHPVGRLAETQVPTLAGHWMASQIGLPREESVLLVAGLLILAGHHARRLRARVRLGR